MELKAVRKMVATVIAFETWLPAGKHKMTGAKTAATKH